MKYKTEPWFQLLAGACERMKRKDVAQALGVSAPQISQVLNGSGKYGSGEAGTDKLAEKVVHTFGRYTCPHLSEQSDRAGQPVVITAEQCRGYAHRAAPTGSPRDMQHWQACNSCPHKAHTAPPVPREVKARKPRNDLSTKEST
jgi:transcriptional regulator with XRE-family HTH domain